MEAEAEVWRPHHRLHGATLVVELVGFARTWLFPLFLAWWLARSAEELPWWIWIGLPITAVSLGRALVRFCTLRYGIHGGRFELRSGWWFRTVRTLPLDRVQNVDLHAGMIHRMLGVVVVRLETAGAGDTEVELSAVLRDVGERLRSQVLDARGRESAPGVALVRPDEVMVRRAGMKDLLWAGATENRMSVLFAGALGLWEWADDLGLVGEDVLETVSTEVSSAGRTLVVLGAALVLWVLGWMASVAWTWVHYHGFELTRRPGELRRRHGLLGRFDGTVPLNRIQAVVADANGLRQLLGWARVRMETAGQRETGETGPTVLYPLLPRTALPGLLSEPLPGLDFDGLKFQRVHPRAFRRMLVRYGFVATLVAAAAAGTWDRSSGLAVLAVGALLAVIWAAAGYRALGYAFDEKYLAVRSGVWIRRWWMAPRAKLQGVALHASPVQRWFGLSTLVLQTAGQSGLTQSRVPDLGVDTAHNLFEGLARAAARGGSGSGL